MIQVKKTSEVALLHSAIDGIFWPAIPAPEANTVLALAYQLEFSQWWAPEVLLTCQLRQIENLLEHAWRTVPYYREPLNDVVKIPTGKLRMDDFKRIPLLRKSDLQAHKNDMKSNRLPKSHLPLHKISTSGSTGIPLTMAGSGVSERFNIAFALRWHTWHRRISNNKIAEAVLPLDNETDESSNVPRWGVGFVSGPKVIMGANQPIERQLEWLLHEKPHYFMTLPSNLNALLQHCEKSGIRIPNLCEIMIRGEPLSDDLRAYCREVWDVPITAAYGSEEFAYIGLQCPEANHYHAMAEHLLIEVLDEDGNHVKPGESGRVVITDLHNFAVPMIRYEIGDYAEVGPSCACGRGLPVITRILGRTRNMFILPWGDKFWPVFSKALADIQDKVPKLVQSQLIQPNRHQVTLRMVVSDTLSQDEEAVVKKGMAAALGGHFEIELDYVDEIPRAASGKFEEAICQVVEA